MIPVEINSAYETLEKSRSDKVEWVMNETVKDRGSDGFQFTDGYASTHIYESTLPQPSHQADSLREQESTLGYINVT